MTVVEYKLQMDTDIQSADTLQAYASLYQLLSVAWSYPDTEFFESLKSGNFNNSIKQSLTQIPHGELLSRASQTLNEELNQYLQSHELIDLETEYVALFENNFQSPVVHLYHHLYVDDERSQIDILKSMTQLYRRLGIILKQDDGVEQPDHLTVQLECMAYCYMRLSQSVQKDMASAANFYFDEIRQFKNQLSWVEKFADQLRATTNHPLYTSLIAFTQALLLTSK